MPQQFYSDDEAEAILQEASQKAQPFGMTRERLLATAAELGITPEAVEEAENSVLVRRQEQTLRKQFDKHQRQEFSTHLGVYLIINAFLLVIDLATYSDSHVHWFFWPLLGWGIALAFHVLAILNRGSEYEKQFQAWIRNRESKAMSAPELASAVASEWLERFPGDTHGAERSMRHAMRHHRRMAKRELD